MAEFASRHDNNTLVDHDTGKKVVKIMEKYVGGTLTEETCDQIMEDIRNTFGDNKDAQVMIDTDTTEIEITIRDSNERLMKCSSLTLFKDK